MSKRPVAFRVVRPGDYPGFTLYHDEALAASEAELCGGEYQGLYVRDGSGSVAQGSGDCGKSWSPDQFWEYVEGLTDQFVRDQIRDALAARGLSLTSTGSGGAA